MLFFGFGWVDASGSQSTAEKKKAPDLPICVVVEISDERDKLLRTDECSGDIGWQKERDWSIASAEGCQTRFSRDNGIWCLHLPHFHYWWHEKLGCNEEKSE